MKMKCNRPIYLAWHISPPYFSHTADFTTENFHLLNFSPTKFFTTEFFTTESFTTENVHYRIFSPTKISPPNFQFHNQYLFIKLPHFVSFSFYLYWFSILSSLKFAVFAVFSFFLIFYKQIFLRSF